MSAASPDTRVILGHEHQIIPFNGIEFVWIDFLFLNLILHERGEVFMDFAVKYPND